VGILADSRAVVITTNYDRIVEYVAESLGVGLSDGFETIRGQVASTWTGQFDVGLDLLKLHGSVTWYGVRASETEFVRLDRGYPLPGPDFT
jgi:hypothetical protein